MRTNANDESSCPYRVTGRVTSWFEISQVAGALTGACAASVASIEARIAAASQGCDMKSKLNAVWSSPGRRYLREAIDVGEPQFTDQDPRPRITVGDGTPAAVDVVELVAVGIRVATRPGLRRDLREGWILDQQGCRVDPDPGRTAVQPEAEDLLVSRRTSG